ncbi:MAG: AMP-binding protein, partial [Coriobacteriales bacterium]|nr:AMP-binding protein [Coriobacteriales bacterium]
MDHILKKYCPRIDFDSYEDFFENFTIDVPENFNFGYDVVDEWARVEPEKRALVWCDDADNEEIFTFSDIARLSNRCANALAGLGIRKGDIVLVMLRQRWEYWVTATALHKLGAIIIPATIQLTKKDLVYRMSASGARAVIALSDPYVLEQMSLALPECPEVQHRILVGAVREGWLSWHQLVDGAGEAADRWERPTGAAATANTDNMLIYFTSGTTGLAKMCTHNFVHPLGHILTAKYWQEVRENKLHLSVSDSGWAKFGWGKIYGQWIAGATIFAYDTVRFSPLELLKRVEHYQVTTFCVPPTMYRFMLQEDVSAFDLSCIKHCSTAGEPLNADVTKRWLEATGLQIYEGFGQSEGPVLLATFPWVEPRPGSMGKPSPLLNIQLLDDAGTPVEDGDEGNICVTGLQAAYPP